MKKDRSWIPVDNWEASLAIGHKQTSMHCKLKHLVRMIYRRKDNL
jgi:hypothetical protein